MIEATKVTAQPIRRLVDPGDPGRGRPPEYATEFHLFMPKTAYGKHANGLWMVRAPGAGSVPIVEPRSVEEHADGTITVHGEPFTTRLGVFRLSAGFFVEVSAGVESAKQGAA